MKYLRRGIGYLATRLFLGCLILALIITVFYYAMNVTNIQIILKDGMAARAKYVMGISTSLGELDNYFSSQYIRIAEKSLCNANPLTLTAGESFHLLTALIV